VLISPSCRLCFLPRLGQASAEIRLYEVPGVKVGTIQVELCERHLARLLEIQRAGDQALESYWLVACLRDGRGREVR
jgi:hypothetical protein